MTSALKEGGRLTAQAFPFYQKGSGVSCDKMYMIINSELYCDWKQAWGMIKGKPVVSWLGISETTYSCHTDKSILLKFITFLRKTPWKTIPKYRLCPYSGWGRVWRQQEKPDVSCHSSRFLVVRQRTHGSCQFKPLPYLVQTWIWIWVSSLTWKQKIVF